MRSADADQSPAALFDFSLGQSLRPRQRRRDAGSPLILARNSRIQWACDAERPSLAGGLAAALQSPFPGVAAGDVVIATVWGNLLPLRQLRVFMTPNRPEVVSVVFGNPTAVAHDAPALTIDIVALK